MSEYRLSALAEFQITRIRAWSEDQFGPVHAMNYEALIRTAIADIAARPDGPGTQMIPGSVAAFEYELRHSRASVPTHQRIGKPWHKIVYRRLPDGIIEILAVIGLSYPSDRAAREGTA